MKEEIDWKILSETIEQPDKKGNPVFGLDADRAIEFLIGEKNIRKAVDYFISGQQGAELARTVLWQIQPWSAMKYCYEIYKSERDVKERYLALALLRMIADSRVLQWIDEFLEDRDEEIQVYGLSIITELIVRNWVSVEDCEGLILKIENHSNSVIREEGKHIRKIKSNA